MRNKLFLLLIAVVFLLTLPGCPTEPQIDNTPPGRRDYVWTVDTLYSPNNTLYAIWGSSPDDIWLGGPGGITQYDRLWHYDGEKWEPYQQYIATFPNCIFGFSKNDVWLGGSDGKIFHFNGNSWNSAFTYNKEGQVTNDIVDIWGDKANDIYATGVIFFDAFQTQRGYLLHYDGTEWKEEFITDFYCQFIKVLKESNDVFLSGIKIAYTNPPDTILFYKYQNNKSIEIFSETQEMITYASMNNIGNEIYFLIGKDLTIYRNGRFNKIMSFDISNFGYQAYGRSLSDIFLAMRDGVAHFNGEDIKYLFKFSEGPISLHKPLIFENDIFFTAKDYIDGGNLVLHGKLKN